MLNIKQFCLLFLMFLFLISCKKDDKKESSEKQNISNVESQVYNNKPTDVEKDEYTSNGGWGVSSVESQADDDDDFGDEDIYVQNDQDYDDISDMPEYVEIPSWGQ